MGGSGSTRRVVVEEVDGSGVVKISDSVVRRIRGQDEPPSPGKPSSESTPPPSPPPPPKTATSPSPPPPPPPAPTYTIPPPATASVKSKAADRDLEQYYTDRLKQLEQRNSELQKITNEQFVKAVQEVEQKFLKHTCSPVCQDLQSKVYECYLGNPQKTLNCSAQVRAFSTCVERARQNALLRKS